MSIPLYNRKPMHRGDTNLSCIMPCYYGSPVARGFIITLAYMQTWKAHDLLTTATTPSDTFDTS